MNVVEVVVRANGDTATVELKGIEQKFRDSGARSGKGFGDALKKQLGEASKSLSAGIGGAGLAGLATALTGPLGAAGVAVGAFAAIAVPELSKVREAMSKTGKQGQQAWKQLTPSEQDLGVMLKNVSAAFGQVQKSLTPVVVTVASFAAALATDAMPALQKLAATGGKVLDSFLVPLDAFVRSKTFAQLISQFAQFGAQAGAILGPAIVQLIKQLLQLFVQVMPSGVQILKALLPAISQLVALMVPAIVAIAKMSAAALTWLSANHLLVPTLIALGLAIGIATGGLSLIIPAVLAIAGALIKAWQSSSTFRDIIKDVGKVLLEFGIIALEENKAVVNAFLWMAGTVVHAAATAFGWVPGLGPKLKGAATAFDNFRSGVNNAFNSMISKMQGWQRELGASQQKANTATQVISGDFGKQLIATNASAKGVNTLAAAIGALHGKTVNIGMNGKGQFTIAQVNQIVGNTSGPPAPKAAGGLITGGVAGRDSVVASLMPGEVVVPTHMVNSGAVDHLRGKLPGFAAGGLVGNLSGSYVTGMYGTFQNRMESAMVSAMRSALTAAERAAAKAAAAAAGAAGPGGGSNAANAALARKLYPAWGSGAEWSAWNSIAMAESGWNNHATNGGRPYNPYNVAYGIPQALPAIKMGAAANPPQSNPTAQINWMVGYIKSVYGDPIRAWAFHRANGYYGAGGATSAGWAVVGEHGRELVKLPGGAIVRPHGQSEQALAGGMGGAAVVHIEVSGGQSAFDQFMLHWLRENARIKGGGNVQKAFGRA